MTESWLESVHFGEVGKPLAAPLPEEEDFDPDDEELDETPADVIAMLGFDPLVEWAEPEEPTDDAEPLQAALQIIVTIFGKDGPCDEGDSRLTRAEACRIATDISHLPELLGGGSPERSL